MEQQYGGTKELAALHETLRRQGELSLSPLTTICCRVINKADKLATAVGVGFNVGAGVGVDKWGYLWV